VAKLGGKDPKPLIVYGGSWWYSLSRPRETYMKGLLFAAFLFVLSSVAFANDQGKYENWYYVIQKGPLDETATVKLATPAVGGDGSLVIVCEGYFVEIVVVR
jgi:hypothetical protein